MTGFGRAAGEHQGRRWVWELKSVNGRGLDLRLRLPQGHDALEPRLRAELSARLKRGNIQAGLQLSDDGPAPQLTVNEENLARIVTLLEGLRQRLPDAEAPRLADILALRGVLETAAPADDDAARSVLHEALAASFAEALAALERSRAEEGARLAAVLHGLVARIDTLRGEAERIAATLPAALRIRITQQLAQLMDAGAAVAEDRLAQELAMLATKADVREELDRLAAHVAQAQALLAGPEPAGRRLDFLTQEFNREANTLCAKAADIELTRIGLEMKVVIDQLREQVQNVE